MKARKDFEISLPQTFVESFLAPYKLLICNVHHFLHEVSFHINFVENI